MTNNFSAKLIAVLAVLGSSLVNAQLPRECFYATELHGMQSPDSDLLLSNLPTLMSMYKPGMRLASIVSLEEDIDAVNKLAGLQVNLESTTMQGQSLELPTVG